MDEAAESVDRPGDGIGEVAKGTTQLPSIPVRRVHLELRAGASGLELPGHGATVLRGALGEALRDVACAAESPCKGCAEPRSCAFGLLFEPLSPPPGWPRRYASVPPPWVMWSASGPSPSIVREGERLRFTITLMGAAMAHAATVVAAGRVAARTGLRGRAEVAEVRVEDQVVAPISKGGAPSRVRVVARSPVALTEKGTLATSLSPELLTARLAARLDLLALAWGRPGRWDHRAVQEQSAQARVIEERWAPVRFTRHSRRRGAVPMRGVVGEALIEGVAPEVLALWSCARILHVGGNTALGFGRVEVEEG